MTRVIDAGALLAGLAPPVRRATIAAVADDAIGFELHRWREAIRGQDAEELVLLWVLHAAGIGEVTLEVSVADELDARLARRPIPPRTTDEPPEKALAAWADGPDDLAAAARWARAQSIAGPNPAAMYPAVLDRESEDGSSVAEGALLVLADAVALVQAPPAIDLATASARLERVEERFGRRIPQGYVEVDPADLDADPSMARARYVDHRQQVLALLLRDVATAGPAAAEEEASAEDVSTLDGGPTTLSGRLRRVAIGLATSALISVVLVLLPQSLPGRIAGDRLAERGQRDSTLTGMGWQRVRDDVVVTVVLADAPDDGDQLALAFERVDGRFVAERDGDSWSVRADGDIPFRVDRTQVLSKGDTVVVRLPEPSTVTGVAVEVDDERLPVDGFTPRQPRADASLNLADLVIVGLLVVAGVRGMRRGLLRSLPVLIGFALNLVLARILYPPLGDLVLGRLTNLPAIANSIAVSVVLAVFGTVTYLLVSTGVGAAVARLTGPPKPSNATTDGVLGAFARVARASAATATSVTLLTNLAGATVVGALLQGSLLGRAAIDVWSHVYPGL